MQKFNIGLVFDREVTSQIIEYAEKLYKQIPSKLSLGKNSLPHMTIIQFTSEESEKNSIWSECKNISIESPSIILSGLTVLPSNSGGAWIEISVLKSVGLLKMQELITSFLPSSLTPDNDTGDKYRPHITIAHIAEPRETINIPIEYKPLRLSNIECSLAIGVGTNFDPCLEAL